MNLHASNCTEGLQQLLHNDGTQVAEPIHRLAHKDQHIHGGQLIGVGEELHEDGNDGARHVRELDAGGVERAHQQLTVFPRVLVLHDALRLADLLLEDEDELLDVARGDELHGDAERLAPNLMEISHLLRIEVEAQPNVVSSLVILIVVVCTAQDVLIYRVY